MGGESVINVFMDGVCKSDRYPQAALWSLFYTCLRWSFGFAWMEEDGVGREGILRW